jgi:hypothetical protein
VLLLLLLLLLPLLLARCKHLTLKDPVTASDSRLSWGMPRFSSSVSTMFLTILLCCSSIMVEVSGSTELQAAVVSKVVPKLQDRVRCLQEPATVATSSNSDKGSLPLQRLAVANTANAEQYTGKKSLHVMPYKQKHLLLSTQQQ